MLEEVPGRRGQWIDISSDGKLVEDIFWCQLGTDETTDDTPRISEADLQTIVRLDQTFRMELEASLKDEAGNWLGAVWPIAVSLLLAER